MVEKDKDGAGAAGDQYPDAAASAASLARAEAQEILDKAGADAKASAGKIVSEARNEAAALLVSAREQAEDERRSAWQEGFAEGSLEGRRSYDTQLETKMREDDEKLRSVVEELYDERERTYGGLEDELIGLAMEIVKRILDPAEAESNVFEALIKNALKQLNPDGKVVIRVNQAEYERFFTSGSAVFELGEGIKVSASVVKDAALGAGGLIIDTGEATVDAGLDSQLKQIRLAFNKCKTES